MRDHAEGAQDAGAHLGDDRLPVTSAAPGQTQFAVQVQGAARVLAVGPDRRDRDARPTAVSEKVTNPLTRVTTSLYYHHTNTTQEPHTSHHSTYLPTTQH